MQADLEHLRAEGPAAHPTPGDDFPVVLKWLYSPCTFTLKMDEFVVRESPTDLGQTARDILLLRQVAREGASWAATHEATEIFDACSRLVERSHGNADTGVGPIAERNYTAAVFSSPDLQYEHILSGQERGTLATLRSTIANLTYNVVPPDISPPQVHMYAPSRRNYMYDMRELLTPLPLHDADTIQWTSIPAVSARTNMLEYVSTTGAVIRAALDPRTGLPVLGSYHPTMSDDAQAVGVYSIGNSQPGGALWLRAGLRICSGHRGNVSVSMFAISDVSFQFAEPSPITVHAKAGLFDHRQSPQRFFDHSEDWPLEAATWIHRPEPYVAAPAPSAPFTEGHSLEFVFGALLVTVGAAMLLARRVRISARGQA